MAQKVDRRVRKTKALLRAGLARLMQTKSIKEITVKELVEEVDINRSTFYLHYSDIYQMLESVEEELMEEITETILSHEGEPPKEDGSLPFIADFFTILDKNRDICRALLGSNGDMAFVGRTEQLIAGTIFQHYAGKLSKNVRDIEYAYAFCLNGCVGVIKAWLADGDNDSPQHMAQLTHQMVAKATHSFMEKNVSV